MFCVVGDIHDLLRGESIVRLLGLPERLLVGIQHRIVELLAGLLRAGEADVVIVPMAVLVLRHGDKGPFFAADDLHAANGEYAVDVHIGVGEGVLAVLHGINSDIEGHGGPAFLRGNGGACFGLVLGHFSFLLFLMLI